MRKRIAFLSQPLMTSARLLHPPCPASEKSEKGVIIRGASCPSHPPAQQAPPGSEKVAGVTALRIYLSFRKAALWWLDREESVGRRETHVAGNQLAEPCSGRPGSQEQVSTTRRAPGEVMSVLRSREWHPPKLTGRPGPGRARN